MEIRKFKCKNYECNHILISPNNSSPCPLCGVRMKDEGIVHSVRMIDEGIVPSLRMIDECIVNPVFNKRHYGYYERDILETFALPDLAEKLYITHSELLEVMGNDEDRKIIVEEIIRQGIKP